MLSVHECIESAVPSLMVCWKYGSVSRQHVGCSSSAPREEKSEGLQLPAGHQS